MRRSPDAVSTIRCARRAFQPSRTRLALAGAPPCGAAAAAGLVARMSTAEEPPLPFGYSMSMRPQRV